MLIPARWHALGINYRDCANKMQQDLHCDKKPAILLAMIQDLQDCRRGRPPIHSAEEVAEWLRLRQAGFSLAKIAEFCGVPVHRVRYAVQYKSRGRTYSRKSKKRPDASPDASNPQVADHFHLSHGDDDRSAKESAT